MITNKIISIILTLSLLRSALPYACAESKTLSEYWDNHVPTKCWKTYSFGAAVMAALWQYDVFSIESWTYQ